MVVDQIRHSESASEIYGLLTGHIQKWQSSAILPEELTNLPVIGINDLNTRCLQLFLELDKASRGLDDKARFAIKEALQSFGAALFRLRSLDSKSNYSMPIHSPQGNRSDRVENPGKAIFYR